MLAALIVYNVFFPQNELQKLLQMFERIRLITFFKLAKYYIK